MLVGVRLRLLTLPSYFDIPCLVSCRGGAAAGRAPGDHRRGAAGTAIPAKAGLSGKGECSVKGGYSAKAEYPAKDEQPGKGGHPAKAKFPGEGDYSDEAELPGEGARR